MRYLIDTDIFIKTAHCNLLEQIAPALKTTKENLYYAEEIIDKISLDSGPLYKEYGASLLRIKPFLEKCTLLENKNSKEWRELFARLKKLDQSTKTKNNGEILLSLTCLTEKERQSLIVSGDKSYIRLLNEADDSYQDIKDGLQNRFITFEYLILKMLQLQKDNHMDFVRQLKANEYGKDGNLKRIFTELENRYHIAYFEAVAQALKNELQGLGHFLVSEA